MTYIIEKFRLYDDTKITKPTYDKHDPHLLEKIQDKYKNVFDDIRLKRGTNNIGLGRLKESGPYRDSIFTIYLYRYDDNITIGRQMGSDTNTKYICEPTLDKAINKLDKLLTKRGYKIN